MTLGQRLSLALIAVIMLTSGALAPAEEHPGDWRQTEFLYGMGMTIAGDADLGPIGVPVDLSISGIFDALDVGGFGVVGSALTVHRWAELVRHNSERFS